MAVQSKTGHEARLALGPVCSDGKLLLTDREMVRALECHDDSESSVPDPCRPKSMPLRQTGAALATDRVWPGSRGIGHAVTALPNGRMNRTA